MRPFEQADPNVQLMLVDRGNRPGSVDRSAFCISVLRMVMTVSSPRTGTQAAPVRRGPSR